MAQPLRVFLASLQTHTFFRQSVTTCTTGHIQAQATRSIDYQRAVRPRRFHSQLTMPLAAACASGISSGHWEIGCLFQCMARASGLNSHTLQRRHYLQRRHQPPHLAPRARRSPRKAQKRGGGDLPPTNRDAAPWLITLLLLASVTAAAGIQLRQRESRRN
jgi:hypothetical protein